VLWMMLFARRDLSVVGVAAMVIGFIGVLLLLQPTAQEGQSIPFLAGLATGMCAATAYRTLWRLGQAGEPGWRIVFYFAASAAFAALLAIPFAGPSNYTPQSMCALAGVGVIGMFSQLAMTQAFRVGSTTHLATLQYSTVLFSAAYGALFWGDRLSLAGSAGLVLIVMSGGAAMAKLNQQRSAVDVSAPLESREGAGVSAQQVLKRAPREST